MDVDALTAEDGEVHRLLAEVLNLAKPLSVLREEPIRSRVEAQQRKREIQEVPVEGRTDRKQVPLPMCEIRESSRCPILI